MFRESSRAKRRQRRHLPDWLVLAILVSVTGTFMVVVWSLFESQGWV